MKPLEEASSKESRRAARLNYFLNETNEELEAMKSNRTDNIMIVKQVLAKLESEGTKPSPTVISFLHSYYDITDREKQLEFQRTNLAYVLELTHKQIIRMHSVNDMCGGDTLGTS